MTDNRLEILTCVERISNMDAIPAKSLINSLYRIIKSYCETGSESAVLREAREEYAYCKNKEDHARAEGIA